MAHLPSSSNGSAQAKRTADFRELWEDLLDESERALEEEDDVAWCAVVHRLLMPVAEREVVPDVA